LAEEEIDEKNFNEKLNELVDSKITLDSNIVIDL
jgi:hypothetical protein